MTVATSYITLSDLKAALGKTLSTEDAYLTKVIAAASRLIDRKTRGPGGHFYLDDTATQREYSAQRRVYRDGTGEGLLVDDIGSTSGLILEEFNGGAFVALDSSLYEFRHENALARGEPITELYKPWAYWSWYRKVRVTAKWGWPTVPDQIVEATLIQSARYYKRKDSPEGVLDGGEFGAIHMSRIDPDVRELIKDFRLSGFG